MGYSSEVTIAVMKKVFDEKGFHLKKDLKDCDNITLISDPDSEEEPFYIFSWNRVKWYDSYPDVSAMMEFLGSIEEEDYGFVRVGEDTADIIEEGSPYAFEISVKVIVEAPGGEDIKEDFFKANSVKFIKDLTKKPKKKKGVT